MSAELDSGGDYGYDLVHEVMTALRTPAVPARRKPSGFPGRPVDHSDGDFGYDQAHEA